MRNVPIARRVFVGLALFMTVVVVAGFWPSYFGPLFLGSPPAANPFGRARAPHEWPRVIHVHAATFLGWMALLSTQALLASTGRMRMHRKLGAFGIGYGLLIIVIGVAVGFTASLHHLAVDNWDMDRAASLLLGALLDMLLFAGFFGAAIVYRRRPDIHKRLMLLAAVALFLPGAVRLVIAIVGPVVWIGVLACLSPVLIGMGYDLRAHRRIHAVYLVGTPILLLRLAGQFVVQEFEPGLEVGRRLLTALMGAAVQ